MASWKEFHVGADENSKGALSSFFSEYDSHQSLMWGGEI